MKKLLSALILCSTLQVRCQHTDKAAEITIYNNYFDFTSNSLLNSVLTKLDIPPQERSSYKAIQINSYLTHQSENNKYQFLPINNYQDFLNIPSQNNPVGLDIRFNDYEKLNVLFLDLSKKKNVKSIRLNIHDLDSLPNSLYTITSLENLEFWTSKLKVISEDIKNLKNLERLRIHEAQMLLDLPNSIGKLNALKILEIDEGNYYGPVKRNLEQIGKLTSLEYLRLANFPIKIPDNFDQLKNLKLVEIYNHFQWYEIDLKNITKNKSIKSLMLTGVKEIDLDNISNLQSMEELYLGPRTDLGLIQKFSKLDNLQRLMITSGDESIPGAIGLCTNVNFLILRNCEQVKELPIEINNLKKLKLLVLRNNFELTNTNIRPTDLDKDLRIFLKNNKKLREIENCSEHCVTNW